MTSNHRCNCPNGSYSIKHTNECYEAQIERWRQEFEIVQASFGGDDWRDLTAFEITKRMSGIMLELMQLRKRAAELRATIEHLRRERDAIEKALREAGYTGDDLAAGLYGLKERLFFATIPPASPEVIAEARRQGKLPPDEQPSGSLTTTATVMSLCSREALEAFLARYWPQLELRERSSDREALSELVSAANGGASQAPREALIPPDSQIGEDEYTRNMLSGAGNWLVSRTGTAWAKQFGYESLMREWGEFILAYVEKRLAPTKEAAP